jgi:hypothetical protein
MSWLQPDYPPPPWRSRSLMAEFDPEPLATTKSRQLRSEELSLQSFRIVSSSYIFQLPSANGIGNQGMSVNVNNRRQISTRVGAK